MDFFYVFLVGTIIGSFLNVIIYRIPIGESIISPPSHCGNCDSRLRPLDLIPILSWIALKGKCRYCSSKISYRYPFVELLTGGLFLFTYIAVGIDQKLVAYLVLGCMLIINTFIDMDHFILPNIILLFGLIAFVLLTVFLPFISWRDSFLGAFVGAVPLLILFLLTKGRGMGPGDVKFMGVIGLYLGWKLSLLTLFLSFILGGIFGILLLATRIKDKTDAIPFGPWIALAAFISMYWGSDIISWYLGL
ncbi:leader peptidase (prepilin peptidase)/N-methyltransferase [Alkalibaculum bacchi]|uniref:Prepilin leader peptidase/N-methyltransferase n=1 Tax=Alkalibaculum bacchi TaxID=645887 RepID=A0A366IAA4_9FIRM|nr:A24 family peptidase [Alkalibaculum bacchi]RBP65290.1 leader peptidase (prepilin peptidase)/N-methyltransferase [Alkalibaculum bacchi]